MAVAMQLFASFPSCPEQARLCVLDTKHEFMNRRTPYLQLQFNVGKCCFCTADTCYLNCRRAWRAHSVPSLHEFKLFLLLLLAGLTVL